MKGHIRENVEDYLRGQLDHAGKAAAEAHLAVCAACRRDVAEARRAGEVMAWLVPDEAPPRPGPDFYFRVQAAIAQEQSQGWLASFSAGLQPRLAYPLMMIGALLVAWMLSVPHRTANAAVAMDGFDAVEYPAAEFAGMRYSDDRVEVSHDRILDNIFAEEEGIE